MRAIASVRIWGRDYERAKAFAASAAAATGVAVEAAPNVSACIADADIICTVTAARDPILFGRDVACGVHINAIGSSRATEAEIDTDLFARARVFADYKPGVLVQGGEFLRAKVSGRVTDDHILGDIGDVAIGRLRSVPSRTTVVSMAKRMP